MGGAWGNVKKGSNSNTKNPKKITLKNRQIIVSKGVTEANLASQLNGEKASNNLEELDLSQLDFDAHVGVWFMK